MAGTALWRALWIIFCSIILNKFWMKAPGCFAIYQRRSSLLINQVYAGNVRINKTWTHDLLNRSSVDYHRYRDEILSQVAAVLNESVFKDSFKISSLVSFRPGACQFEIALHDEHINNALTHNLTKIFKEGLRKIYDSSKRDITVTDIWFIDSKDGVTSDLHQPNNDIPLLKSKCTTLSFPPCMGLDYTSSLDLETFSHQRSPTERLGLSNYRIHANLLARNCSPYALDFVCSLSYPRCHDGKYVLPCQQFCNEVYTSCNFAHTCKDFTDDDDPSTCYMPKELLDRLTPKLLPVYCDEKHFLCDNLECITPIKRCDGTVDCSDGSDETHCWTGSINSLQCNFENASWCGMAPAFDTNFMWSLVRAGSIAFSNDLGLLEILRDHTTNSTTGWVAMAEASGKFPLDVARMTIRSYSSMFNYCLHFYYTMPSRGSSQLNVYISYGEGRSYFERPLVVREWSRSGWSPHWRHGQVDLQSGKVKVIFEVVRGPSYKGDVMLDDVSLVVGKCPPINCSSTEYLCSSTMKCIGLERMCDKVNDCGDNSDESECDCSENEFQCETGGCIAGWRRCDAKVDCFDGSDEEECQCPMGQVNCSASGKCIMREWLCDGESDCEQGEDERNCGSCNETEFQCASHGCISSCGRCDGKLDCLDGSDEIGCLRLTDWSVVEVVFDGDWKPLCAEGVTRDDADKLCKLLGMGKMLSMSLSQHHDDVYIHLTRFRKPVTASFRKGLTCHHHHVLVLTCEPKRCAAFPPVFSDPWTNVVGGRRTELESWSWMVGLHNGRLRKCGATLIDSRHLLTAAHCFDVATSLRMYSVRRGVSSRSLEGVYIHPDYSRDSYWFNDLAVVRLKEPMSSFEPACLFELETDLPPNKISTCYAAKWIFNITTGSYHLNKTKLKIWDDGRCKASYRFVSKNNFCAGYESGHDGLCRGDSGNALLCRGAQTESWKMVGVFSFFFDECNTPMMPSGFLNISSYVPWIRSITTCPFWCENGQKCIWTSSSMCNEVSDCQDGSDEDDELCGRNVTCNFEDPRLCGYKHVFHQAHHGRWLGARMMEEPSSINWGPLFDHTLGNASGHFLLGGSKPASILSPTFRVAVDSCLLFYFIFRGDLSRARFLVHLRNASTFDRNSMRDASLSGEVFVSTREAYKWEPVKIDIPKGQYFVEFRIQTQLHNLGHEYSHENYIGLDDVTVFSGRCHKEVCTSGRLKCENRNIFSCEDRKRKCNVIYDCDGPSDEKNCTDSYFSCTMENIRDCNFVQLSLGRDHLDWTILPVSSTFMHESGGPLYDHTYKSTAGHVAYFSTFGINPMERAILEIPIFLSESSGTSGCFRFHLSMISTSSLTVYMSVRGSFTRLVASFERLHQQEWAEIEIPINYKIETVIFLAEILERPNRGPGYIAIDDIYISRGGCKNNVIPPLACHENLGSAEYMFVCRDGSGCIGENLVCNLQKNCRDGSDEESCDRFKCFGGEGMISNLCDGHPNCFFGEDEADCGPCNSKTQFQCISGDVSCIPLENRCDNLAHCADGSDEVNCVIQNQEGILQGFKSQGHHPFCASQWNNTWNDLVCQGINGGSAFHVISLFELLDKTTFLVPVDQSLPDFSLDNFYLDQDCPSNRVVHLVCMPSECGLPSIESLPEDARRGNTSQPGQWPYIVSILKNSDHICSGVLVHESWVLTAARCFIMDNLNHRTASPYLMPKLYFVRGGSVLKDGPNLDAQTIRVKRIHLDVYFDRLYFYPDIALVELELPLATGDLVKPACLPTTSITPSDDCYLVGWNILNDTQWVDSDEFWESAETSHLLMHIGIDLTTRGECPHQDSFYPGQVCVGNITDLIHKCHAESGGLLMCRSPADLRWSVLGILTSKNPSLPCASDPPSSWTVFTAVQNFMDWIPLVMTSSH